MLHVSDDPYNSPVENPTAETWAEKTPTKPGEAPVVVTEHLRCTRPWVNFVV